MPPRAHLPSTTPTTLTASALGAGLPCVGVEEHPALAAARSTAKLVFSEALRWQSPRAYAVAQRCEPLYPSELAGHLDRIAQSKMTAGVWLDFDGAGSDPKLALVSSAPLTHLDLDQLLSVEAPNLTTLIVHAPVRGRPISPTLLSVHARLDRLWPAPGLGWGSHSSAVGTLTKLSTYATHGRPGDSRR
ncbi:hypothetical protein AURDEDRAFT_162170 [Auricularia subglabra TFB-10046 SS5]|nr:hypothetical protein AURDEDRAFT_162170 [Auricularia subglabra TFB-10046 SS5]